MFLSPLSPARVSSIALVLEAWVAARIIFFLTLIYFHLFLLFTVVFYLPFRSFFRTNHSSLTLLRTSFWLLVLSLGSLSLSPSSGAICTSLVYPCTVESWKALLPLFLFLFSAPPGWNHLPSDPLYLPDSSSSSRSSPPWLLGLAWVPTRVPRPCWTSSHVGHSHSWSHFRCNCLFTCWLCLVHWGRESSYTLPPCAWHSSCYNTSSWIWGKGQMNEWANPMFSGSFVLKLRPTNSHYSSHLQNWFCARLWGWYVLCNLFLTIPLWVGIVYNV